MAWRNKEIRLVCLLKKNKNEHHSLNMIFKQWQWVLIMIECCTSEANCAGFIHTRCLVAFVVTFCLECSETGTSGIRTTAFFKYNFKSFSSFVFLIVLGFLVED